MTNVNSKAFKNNHKHDGANWPYHYNARKHKMVPCKTNPCRYHSNNGNDFNITSYDEANNILNEALREAGINNTNDLSSDDANIILKSYLSKNKTKNTSTLSSRSNTNSIDSSNANRIIIPNKMTKKISLRNTHANHVNINNMITSNELDGNTVRNGEYYIYCSPVSNDDTDEVAARKIQEFCDYVSMMGIFKIADANLISGDYSKRGVVLTFHVDNNDDYNRMMSNDGILQKLANDYDDGNGLLVFNKNPSIQSQDSINIVHARASDIIKTLNDNGYDAKNLYGYEYKNKNNKRRTLIANINGDKNKIIPFLQTQNYVMSSRNCNIRVFKRSN